MAFQLEVGIHNNDTNGVMCSNSRQTSGVGGRARVQLQTLWTRTDSSSETAVLLWT